MWRILDHFLIIHHCGIRILGQFYPFSNSHRRGFTKLGEITEPTRQLMNPQYFGGTIRIRINPEIRIGIPEHFQVTFWRWESLRSLNAFVWRWVIAFLAYSDSLLSPFCKIMGFIWGENFSTEAFNAERNADVPTCKNCVEILRRLKTLMDRLRSGVKISVRFQFFFAFYTLESGIIPPGFPHRGFGPIANTCTSMNVRGNLFRWVRLNFDWNVMQRCRTQLVRLIWVTGHQVAAASSMTSSQHQSITVCRRLITAVSQHYILLILNLCSWRVDPGIIRLSR